MVGLQPFGYDRAKSVATICEGMSWEYDYEFRKGKYRYAKLHSRSIMDIELDMIYESNHLEKYDLLM